MSIRAPAIPLIAHDPTFSVWSFADRLTERWPSHWTGQGRGMAGMVRIDGEARHFCAPLGALCPELEQVAVEVLPTRTIYRFADPRIALTVTFCSPLLADDLDLLARPLSYVSFAVESRDGREHRVELYLDIGLEWATDQPAEAVNGSRTRIAGLEVLRAACTDATVLGSSGDHHRCNWGTVLLAAEQQPGLGSVIATHDVRRAWAAGSALPADDLQDFPRAASRGWPVLALTFDLGAVGTTAVERHLMVAYDEQWQAEYLGRRVRPWWRRNGLDAAGLLRIGAAERAAVLARCAAFDARLMAELTRVGGTAYADLGALSWRQCLAAHALCADLDGSPLHFSKENFSNGCIATVDVTYPGAPFFLLYAPELLKAQVRPLLDYALSPRWTFPFAPHDLGTYPLANGQVYGGGEDDERDQMPVEECGNLVLLVAALHVLCGEQEFARRYWGLLTRWTDYLVAKGLDPEHQLCTDDFAGHLAHNANLSLKAILAIAAHARMARDLDPANAARYRGIAERMAAEWLRLADDGDHYRLTFDRPGSWSQKYNLVWDRLLDLGLFPAEVARREVAHYKRVQTRYGLALDDRQPYTKLDWVVWSATLAEDPADFRALVAPLATWADETPTRVPLCDWFWVTDGRQAGFQARSVVGGVFIGLLADQVRARRQAGVSAAAAAG